MSQAATSPDRAAAVPGQAPGAAEVMARMPEENFPVAAFVLGARRRAQLRAIYGFARLVDQLGDEARGDRLALLDWAERELDAVYGAGRPEHPVMRSLQGATQAAHLPDAPFRRLIEANRVDQAVTRYETFEDLLGYCRLSATPVGELVLHVFGAATPERIELSDRICSALQVIEHLQDVAEDRDRGRVYLPQEDLHAFGCRESDLAASTASNRVRALVAFQAERARQLLAGGAPLAASLPWRPRLAVAGFVAGGRAALGGIERAGYDVLAGTPALSRPAFLAGWRKAVGGR